MDAPAEPTTRRRRSRAQTCPKCGETFVDPDAFSEHSASCQGGKVEPDPPAPEPAPAPEETPAPTTRRRSRQTAMDAPEAQMAPEPVPSPRTPAATPTPAPVTAANPINTANDLTVPVNIADDPNLGDAGLGPLQWEPEPSGPSVLSQAYSKLEDFSEFTVLGAQKAVGTVGGSVGPAMSIFIQGLIVLLIGSVFLLSGVYVGKKFGPLLTGQAPVETPIIPPVRVDPTSPISDPVKQARQVVNDFYAALDGKSYSLAYDYLSPSWQQELSFSQFEKGYNQNQSITCDIVNSRQDGENKVIVETSIRAVENGQTHNYNFQHVVQRVEGGWRITSGQMLAPTSSPTP